MHAVFDKDESRRIYYLRENFIQFQNCNYNQVHSKETSRLFIIVWD